MTLPLFIGVSGKSGHGKDTTYGIIRDLLPMGYVGRASFADTIRVEASGRGIWDGIMPPTPEGRTILQEYGVARRQEDPDYWVNAAFARTRLTNTHKVWVFTDVRFPNEADAIRKKGGVVFRLERLDPNDMGRTFNNGLSQTQKSHVSETALDDYPYFERLIVHQTIDDLRRKVRHALLQWLIERY